MTASAVSQSRTRDESESPDEILARRRQVRQTLCCPHCGEELSKWQVPDSPFNEWPSEYQFICFNDRCPYFKRGWATMAAQGSFGSYRFMYDPTTHGFHPVAVLSNTMLRDSIVAKDA